MSEHEFTAKSGARLLCAEPKCPLHDAAPELLAALEELTARCDGEEGVRPDGSNIQTIRAHAAIAQAKGEK